MNKSINTATISIKDLKVSTITASKIIALPFGEAMGYYSTFEISYTGPADVVDMFETSCDNGETRVYGSMNPTESDNWDTMKWYEYDEEMTEMSKQWPSLTFVLRRAGEESGDLQMCWYKNGKVWAPNVKITFEAPPEGYFDEI